MRIANPVAGLVRGFSLVAAAVLMLAAAPGKPAQADVADHAECGAVGEVRL
jgi:hypothetical protein